MFKIENYAVFDYLCHLSEDEYNTVHKPPTHQLQDVPMTIGKGKPRTALCSQQLSGETFCQQVQQN